jgi:hypothetical protein
VGEYYGIIAEELEKVFPAYVDNNQKNNVPNCLASATYQEHQNNYVTFSHDNALKNIEPDASKIRLFAGASCFDVDVVSFDSNTITVFFKQIEDFFKHYF